MTAVTSRSCSPWLPLFGGGVGRSVAVAVALPPTLITDRRLTKSWVQDPYWGDCVGQGPYPSVAARFVVLMEPYSTRPMVWPAPVAGAPDGSATPWALYAAPIC